MKTSILILAWIGGFLLGLSAGIKLVIYMNPVMTDMPEEYKLITKQDTLQGYYNSKEDKVYIWFNNKRNNTHK